jgi:hypothetical protein
MSNTPAEPVGEAPVSHASVAQDIRAAFAGAETRPAPPLFRAHPDEAFWEAYCRNLDAEFLAHPGPPTATFLDEHARQATHLLPVAERWFWRALLLAAVETPWDRHHDDRTLSHALWALKPAPHAVLTGRTDSDDVHNLRRRFTPAERVAVARFLRLAVEGPTFEWRGFAYRASQAIVWCWTDDPASTRAAHGLRDEARAYRRPPADDLGSEALIVAIERAFADTPPPVGPLMDGLDEAEYTLEFAGADWRTLTPWFLDLNADAFSSMTPAAFRYFLPAALCHALGPGSEVNIDFHLVSCLVDPSSYRDSKRARVAIFSAAERAAVAAVLRARAGCEE